VICTIPDDFIEDKPIWVAVLSNGITAYQDDDRPGLEPSSWLRLREYVKQTESRIIKLYLKFRSHVECPMPDNAEHYYFCKKAAAFWDGSPTRHSVLIGYANDDTINVQEWAVPELIQIGSETREVSRYSHLII
jgi:hypothetical protein